MITLRYVCSPVFRLPGTLKVYSARTYHCSNYDANSGQGCKMQTECVWKSACDRLSVIRSKFYKAITNEYSAKEYPEQLQEIISRSRGEDPDCELYKHDVHHYQPSDKTRRYQRTWPDCPMIWLQPKPICCHPKDYSEIPRRAPKPYKPPLTQLEKFKYEMAQLCKTCRMDHKVVRKCLICPTKHCKRNSAPFPSFSECKTKYIERYSPTECACKLMPKLSDIWLLHHRNIPLFERRTQSLVNSCPYKRRARPPY